MGHIDSFVNGVRKRLTLRRTLQATLWSFVIGGAILCLAGLVYYEVGYAVPRLWYVIVGGASLIAAVAGSLMRRATPAEASLYADNFFSLKDSVTSARRFSIDHKEGGFYDLQADSANRATAALNPANVPCKPPPPLAVAAGLVVIAAACTAFISPSQAVLDRLAFEKQTEGRTEEVRKQLEDAVDELEKSLDEEEQEVLNPDELKKWIKELKATKDLKEAMRQLADLERKLNDASKNLEVQKKDEQLLKKAGEELQKEEEPNARELGKKLKEEKFKDAADKLKEMKPSESKEQDKNKKLDQKKKELAKLKAAAKRMSAAAKQSRQNNGKNQKNSENAEQGQKGDQDLEQMLEDLEEEASEMEEALQEGDEQECEMCEGELGEKIDGLFKRLSKLDAKKKSQMKLAKLGKMLGQCQSYCQGRGQLAGKGGLKPGVGTDETRRNEKDALEDNGQFSQIKGEKRGDGPSMTKIEAADDGTGTSHRKGEARERNFQKQFESFIQREDVPEEIKDGVKNYFNSVHDAADKITNGTSAEKPAEAAPATK